MRHDRTAVDVDRAVISDMTGLAYVTGCGWLVPRCTLACTGSHRADAVRDCRRTVSGGRAVVADCTVDAGGVVRSRSHTERTLTRSGDAQTRTDGGPAVSVCRTLVSDLSLDALRSDDVRIEAINARTQATSTARTINDGVATLGRDHTRVVDST